MKQRMWLAPCVIVFTCWISANPTVPGNGNSAPPSRGLVATVRAHEMALPPVGTIVPYLGSWKGKESRNKWEERSGWAVCDGRKLTELSWWQPASPAARQLKELLEGKNQNRLPDLTRRVPVGLVDNDNGRGEKEDGWSICGTGGQATVKLSGAQIPKHAHRVYPHAAEPDANEGEHPYWGRPIQKRNGAGGDDETTKVKEVYENGLTGTGVYRKCGKEKPEPIGGQPVPVRDPYFATYYIIRLR